MDDTLDYISQWFYKGSLYIKNSKAICAFVSTNSICQGEHVSLLWNHLFKLDIEIVFAYSSFKWTNNAKDKANVICVIVGIATKNIRQNKFLFEEDKCNKVSEISPLLSATSYNTIVEKRNTSISNLLPILLGSLPADDNNLSLDKWEYEQLLNKYPELTKFIKPFIGSQEIIKGIDRYCLWITKDDVDAVYKYPDLVERFKKVSAMRLASSKSTTQEKAKKPWSFSEIRFNPNKALVIPAVSSGRRKYIPIGIVNEDTVVYHSAFAIYNYDLFTFAIVASYIHILWSRTVGGKLKNDYRYSAQLCYNTFPFPKISDSKRAEIEAAAKVVLKTRRNVNNLGKTLAEMYDPETMPADLREAHQRLDDIVDSCYPGYPFANDDERLTTLFKMYEKMTHN